MITKFTPYQIQTCFFDKKRTIAFKNAIFKMVKKGDVVIDVGSGSGVLGLFAAKKGAKKVICIESDLRFIEIIKMNAKINKVSNIIEIIHDDATKVRLS